jgi:hypothetical protein
VLKRLLSRVIFLSLLVTLLNMYASKAQTTPSPAVAEPQYIDVFSTLDPNGKLTELDRQNVTTFRSKVNTLPGYATVKVLAEIKSAHSSIRLPANAQFVVRGRSALDPSFRYELRLLQTSKNHREIMMTQGGTVPSSAAAPPRTWMSAPSQFDSRNMVKTPTV